MNPASMSPELIKQNNGPQLVIIIWVFASLSLVVVSIKTWTRFRILHRSGLEDLFIFLAWVLSLVYAALLTASVHSGLGKHPYAIEPSAFVRTLKLYTISIPFGTLSVALPTISLAIILNDITSPTARQRWLLFGIPTLNALIKVVDVILICTTCALLSARENLQPDTKCFSGNVVINYVYFAISHSAFTIIFLTVWPMVAFWKLRLNPKAKIVIVLLFSTTAVAAACALVRVSYLPKLRAFEDFTYVSIGYTRWVVIEANVIIITACVPGLRPFVKYLRNQSYRNRSVLEIAKDPHPSHDTYDLPSPTSARRMEPRSSGSVSHSLQPPTPRLNKEMTLARIVSKTEDVENQAPEQWPGTEEVKWKAEEAETPGKDQMRGNGRRKDSRRISAPIRVAEKELSVTRPLSR